MEQIRMQTKEERIRAYIEKTQDPYCFLCGNTKVTMRFSDEDETIEEKLKQYIRSNIRNIRNL